MTPEEWNKVKALFDAALVLEPSQRAAFLAQDCPDDRLRHEVEKLLINFQEAGSRLSNPVLHPHISIEGHPMIGRHLGVYELERRIGQGGMATVFLAKRADGEFSRQVAIKLLLPGLDSHEVLNRFRRERQTLAALDHPNIVKLLDGGSTPEGLPYLVMDYVEGSPIDEYCDGHKLSIEQRLRLFGKVCEAVQHAHEKLVIHRDLKPGNILITADGVPKLLDFGIAKVVEPAAQLTTLTQTGARCMTLAYASPEQVRGKSVTAATDIYSLGAVLYELLTGHRPYSLKDQTASELERAICEQEPAKPSTAVNRVESESSSDGTTVTRTPELVSQTRENQPERLRRRLQGDLDTIVLKALQKEPERRYASVEQLSEDIRRHLNGEPVLARRDTLWYRSSKFLKRNQAAVLAVALTAVTAVLIAIGLGFLTARPQVHSVAVLPFASVGADQNTGYLSEGITEAVRNELSRLPNLKVISSASAVGNGGSQPDPRAVGRSLKAEGMLAGSVVQSGDELTVRAALVDVRTNRHLWEAAYTRKLSEIVVLQKEIARQIAAHFTQRTGSEGEERTEGGTENPAAYREYLVGRHLWSQRSPEALEQGLQHFQRAVELDPNYGLAYSGLADSYVGFATFRVRSAGGAYVKARTAAVKALELEPTLAEGHSALAMVNLYYDWDWAAAEREFKRATTLKPGDTTTRLRYGAALAWFRRFDEARREIARGLEADPVHPLLNAGMAQIFYWERRYDEAIEQYLKALELDPNYFQTYFMIGQVQLETGAYDKAIAELKRAIELGGGPQVKATLADAYALSGQTGEAKKIIADLTDRSSGTYAPPFDVALAYIGLGDYNQAFAWLEKAFNERARAMLSLKVHPRLDPLRSDPRLAVLTRRMKVFDAN